MGHCYEACPNPDQSQCKYKHPYADTHHLLWPKKDYHGRMEKRFRELFTEIICRCEHDAIHQLPPPEKPSQEIMRATLSGEMELNGNPS